MINKKLLFLFVCISFIGVASTAYADVISLPNPLCPLNNPGGRGCISSFLELITAITSYIFTIIGGLAVVMFVWAGILFLTAGANVANIEKGKHATLYAVIGLAIALGGNGLLAVVRAVIGSAPAP